MKIQASLSRFLCLFVVIAKTVFRLKPKRRSAPDFPLLTRAICLVLILLLGLPASVFAWPCNDPCGCGTGSSGGSGGGGAFAPNVFPGGGNAAGEDRNQN